MLSLLSGLNSPDGPAGEVKTLPSSGISSPEITETLIAPGLRRRRSGEQRGERDVHQRAGHRLRDALLSRLRLGRGLPAAYRAAIRRGGTFVGDPALGTRWSGLVVR